jgi:hypothetical protein
VVARGRGDLLEDQIDADEPLTAGDRLYLVGRIQAVAEATHLLTRGSDPNAQRS